MFVKVDSAGSERAAGKISAALEPLHVVREPIRPNRGINTNAHHCEWSKDSGKTMETGALVPDCRDDDSRSDEPYKAALHRNRYLISFWT